MTVYLVTPRQHGARGFRQTALARPTQLFDDRHELERPASDSTGYRVNRPDLEIEDSPAEVCVADEKTKMSSPQASDICRTIVEIDDVEELSDGDQSLTIEIVSGKLRFALPFVPTTTLSMMSLEACGTSGRHRERIEARPLRAAHDRVSRSRRDPIPDRRPDRLGSQASRAVADRLRGRQSQSRLAGSGRVAVGCRIRVDDLVAPLIVVPANIAGFDLPAVRILRRIGGDSALEDLNQTCRLDSPSSSIVDQ